MVDRLVFAGHYLHDDASPLRRQPPFLRSRYSIGEQWQATFLTPALWAQAAAVVSGFSPPAWQTLLLDASAALPNVAPAIALAEAALETYLDRALPMLPRARRLPPGVLAWAVSRRKAAEPEEQLDSLLLPLAGRSLKTDAPALWQQFRDLEKARNTLLHDGAPRDTTGRPVDSERASALIASVTQIIDWFDGLLPPDKQLPTYRATHTLTFARTL